MSDVQSMSVPETLEEEWSSYKGLGVNATKGLDSLVLRESIGGGKFAIVKLVGGCWSNSKMQVLEEIQTSSQPDAEKHFDKLAHELGFVRLSIRTIAELFKVF